MEASGARVGIIFFKNQRTENYIAVDFPTRADSPTQINAQDRIAHYKVMVMYGMVVITGSFNLTKGAGQEKG